MDQQNRPEKENNNNTNSKQPDRSNRNTLNEQTIVAKDSIAYNTENLKAYLKTNSQKTNKPLNISVDAEKKPWLNDIRNGSKFYELIGYTTVGKVEQTFEKSHRQNILIKFLITIILIIIIILAFIIFNPIQMGVDFNKILGIKSDYNNSNIAETNYIVIEGNTESTNPVEGP